MIWPRQVKPVHAGHLDVERHDLWIERPHQLKSLGAVACHPDVEIAFLAENSFEQLPHQRGIVGDEKFDHEAFDARSGMAAIELGEHIRFDLIEKLRRIDQQDHAVLRIQVCHAADQAHLLRRHFRRRANGARRQPHDF